MDVAVDQIRNHFLDIYLQELADLRVGYNFNLKKVCYLKRLLGVIYYLENADLTPNEAINIIETII